MSTRVPQHTGMRTLVCTSRRHPASLLPPVPASCARIPHTTFCTPHPPPSPPPAAGALRSPRVQPLAVPASVHLSAAELSLLPGCCLLGLTRRDRARNIAVHARCHRRPVRSLGLSRFLTHLLPRCSRPLGAGEIGTLCPEARTDLEIELKSSFPATCLAENCLPGTHRAEPETPNVVAEKHHLCFGAVLSTGRKCVLK